MTRTTRGHATAALVGLALMSTVTSGCFTVGRRQLVGDWDDAAEQDSFGIMVPVKHGETGLVPVQLIYSRSNDESAYAELTELAVGYARVPRGAADTFWTHPWGGCELFPYAGVGGSLFYGKWPDGQGVSVGGFAHCGVWGYCHAMLLGVELRATTGLPLRYPEWDMTPTSVQLMFYLLTKGSLLSH